MSSNPIRIQRKRTAGWRMPANTVYVGRPGKFGNPFSFKDFLISLSLIHQVRQVQNHEVSDNAGREWMVDSFEKWIKENPELLSLAKKELKGKNLACWCSLKEKCHADILLMIVNE